MNDQELQRLSDKLKILVTTLEQGDKQERFRAAYSIENQAVNAGELVKILQVIALNEKSPINHTATWLIREIGKQTSARWSKQVDQLLCPRCIVHCYAHNIKLPRFPKIVFYGCRQCNQSQSFIKFKGAITAVLDHDMTSKYTTHNGTLYVNCLLLNNLPDFDRLDIIKATDEDVERFAVSVGNDTDEVRRPYYKQMACIVTPNCGISKNSIRILKHTFGNITIKSI